MTVMKLPGTGRLAALLVAGLAAASLPYSAGQASPFGSSSEDFTEGEPQTREEASRTSTQLLTKTISSRPRQVVRNVLLRPQVIDINADASGSGEAVAAEQWDQAVAGTDADGDAWDRFMRNAGVWTNIAVQASDDKVTDFRAETVARTVLVGYDRFVRDDLLVGVSLRYTRTQTDSTSRGFFADQTNDQRIETASLAPYMAYILDDVFYFDWTLGATTEKLRSSTAGGGITGFSSTEGKTYFTAVGANAVAALSDRWTLTANLGFTRSITTFDGTAERLTQTAIPSQKVGTSVVSGAMQFGYVMDRVIPYITVGFDYHATDRFVGLEEGVVGVSGVNQQENERFNGIIALGFDMYASDHFTVSAEISKADFFRFGNRTIGGLLNLRYDF